MHGGQDHLSAVLPVPASAENFFRRNLSFILVAPVLYLPQESTSIFEAEQVGLCRELRSFVSETREYPVVSQRLALQ